MLRFRISCADDVDEDFLDAEEQEWEDAICEDPYWDEDEEEEREWCD